MWSSLFGFALNKAVRRPLVCVREAEERNGLLAPRAPSWKTRSPAAGSDSQQRRRAKRLLLTCD